MYGEVTPNRYHCNLLHSCFWDVTQCSFRKERKLFVTRIKNGCGGAYLIGVLFQFRLERKPPLKVHYRENPFPSGVKFSGVTSEQRTSVTSRVTTLCDEFSCEDLGSTSLSHSKMAVEGDDTSAKKAALDYSFLKGFATGVVFSHVNKRLILGLVAGTLTGAYLQQNYEGIPNVEDMAKRFVQSIRDAMKKKNP